MTWRIFLLRSSGSGSESKRKPEEEFKGLLEEKGPEVLGGILDILVKALNSYPDLEVPSLFRMTDFTKWGCAITEAMGLDRGLFIEAYRENIEKQSLEAIKASPVAGVLIEFMELRTTGNWSGTATQLWSELQEMAEAMKVSTRQKAWPKNSAALTHSSYGMASRILSVSVSGRRRLFPLSSVTIASFSAPCSGCVW